MPKAKTAQSRAETTEQHAPSGAGNKENTPLQFDVRIQSIRPPLLLHDSFHFPDKAGEDF